MKIYYKVFVILLSTLFGILSEVNASHVSGADLTYECVGQDSFLVTLDLYRDCSGISPITATIDFRNSCGGSFSKTINRQSVIEISQICAFDIGNTTCNGGLINGLEHYVFSGIVVLNSSCTDWTISWSTCCRNGSITNVVNSISESTHIYATFYRGVDSCNNSPSFSLPPIPNVCLNQPVDLNLGIVESDGDSLVYFLTPAIGLNPNSIAYMAPYTFAIPLPDTNLTLDSLTGIIHFTPNVIGVFVVALRIEEYQRSTGTLKGESIVDFQVNVGNCSSVSPELNAPGITNYTGDGSRVDSNTIAVCAGDAFSFDLVFSDPDLLDTLSLAHNIHQSFDNNATVSFTGTNPLTATISCTAPYVSTRIIPISFMATDDACPVMNATRVMLNIEVTQKTKASNDKIICDSAWVGLEVTGGTIFNWSVLSGSAIDTNMNSTTFNMTCTSCANPRVSPQVTTTYLVVSNNLGVCGNTDTVEVTVAPSFGLSIIPDYIICTNDSVQLWTQETPSTNQYTYQWSPSAGLSNDTISNPFALPTTDNTYKVRVSSSLGCIKSKEVNLSFDHIFPKNISIFGISELCDGDSTMLEVDLGGYKVGNCGPGNFVCGVNKDSVIIGTGTSTNSLTNYPAPYGNYYKGARHQILFTASELNAMGFYGGQINSIAFDVFQTGYNVPDFKIK